ncbi:unnamed protein product, partial [Medioppia subpectinata]
MRYYFYDYWLKECDPRTRTHFISRGGPERCLAIMLLWLLFVTRLGPNMMRNRKPMDLRGVILGPNMMRNRKPMDLRGVMFVYNTFMVAINGYFFVRSILWLDFGQKLLDFEFPANDDYSPKTLNKIDEHVMYCYTKYIDLLDTIFFVLRKKNTHISFLHVYHHFMVPVLAWVVLKIAPTVVPIGVFTLLNTFVHTFMYSYYALSAFGPGMHRYLWWKRYITIAQIIQFAIFITYGVFSIFLSNGYPRALYWS